MTRVFRLKRKLYSSGGCSLTRGGFLVTAHNVQKDVFDGRHRQAPVGHKRGLLLGERAHDLADDNVGLVREQRQAAGNRAGQGRGGTNVNERAWLEAGIGAASLGKN